MQALIKRDERWERSERVVRSVVAGKENVVVGQGDGVIDFSDEQADTLHTVEHVVVGQQVTEREREMHAVGHPIAIEIPNGCLQLLNTCCSSSGRSTTTRSSRLCSRRGGCCSASEAARKLYFKNLVLYKFSRESE
eukprot:SAG22_NODE_4759_length_1172_cov_1.402610_2_plen_136_part_00